MKSQPDLNKLRFTKLHRKKRIIRVNKGNKGRQLTNCGSLVMVLKQSKIITVSQLDSMRKLIIRRLKARQNKNQKNLKIIKSQAKQTKKQVKKKKAKEKNMIIRYNFNLGLTKKPLQVRMGKGKGSPVDWVYPCSKDRVLVEFSPKRLKLKKIKRILFKSSEKLPCNIRFARQNKGNKLKSFLKFNLIGEKTNKIVTCVKEL